MEGLSPLHKRVAGIDVHRMLHVVTLLIEQEDGSMLKETKSFGGFKRDMVEMAQWLYSNGVQLVVMESTGIYWKSAFSHLESAGITTWVVNARAVKHVPGRKTDICDSEWLAVLARFGLVRASFIPPKDLRELRIISRHRRKLASMLASETNRLHKILDDAGIKLGAVVTDIKGVSAQAMIGALIEGIPIDKIPDLARGTLKKKRDVLADSLEGELSPRHIMALRLVSQHIQFLKAQLQSIDGYLIEAMQPYLSAWQLLQTIPGVDALAAAMILIETGDDMSVFGSPEQLASWAALCPGNHESAGKRKTGKTRKGNAIIRYILCECANSASKTKSSLAAKFRSLMVRKSYKKSIIAIAHKIIRLVYFILTRQQPYRDPGVAYEAMAAQRNAPRWIKALQKIGKLPTALA
jgi:transposase